MAHPDLMAERLLDMEVAGNGPTPDRPTLAIGYGLLAIARALENVAVAIDGARNLTVDFDGPLEVKDLDAS